MSINTGKTSHLKRIFSLPTVFLIANFCAGAAAQNALNTAPAAISTKVRPAVRTDTLRAHVEFLADDLLEGRGAGTRGHALAAAYVAAQFKQLGLKPAGDANSYLQSVPLLEATVVLPGSAAKFVRDGNTTTFEDRVDFLPGADYSAPTSTLSAPLAFVGFGISAPELGHDDFANVEVRDRVAVVLAGAPAKFPHHQRAFYSWNGEKNSALIKRGAIGIITIDTPQEAARTPWNKRVAMSWQPQMRWLNDEGQPADAHLELKQRFRFKSEAAAKFFENAERTLDQVFETAAAGEAQGFQLPGNITLSATTGLRRTESMNVLGVLEGSDPALKRQVIVVTAHLDHLGRGAAVNGDAIYNGAHDNASGIAVLLEIARALTLAEARPQRSLLFAAVTAEEKGLLGSDYLANHFTLERHTMVANLNIDMPLLLAATQDLIAFGAEHSSLGPIARRVIREQGYRLSADREPQEVRFIRSDQFSFVRLGIPALNLISGSHARSRKVDAVALQKEFREEHYHQPSDDLSLPMNYDAAAGLVAVNTAILLEIANAPTAPFFYREDFFHQKFGKKP
ncbi:MAG: M28 family peptidase [Candidatus Obscuribacterales bacterium]|nr:M28 family peptidase [Steroidobacteraceae bacterium]